MEMMTTRPSGKLGRGLAALMGEPVGDEATAVRDIDTRAIKANPRQPRGTIDPDSLTELAASIRAQGVLQAILVRPHPHDPGQYQIIAGERRWRASMLAERVTVPCHIRPLSDEQASAAALVENLQRTDLTPLEEAEGYRRLLAEFGLTHQLLGQAVGKSRSHVANLLRLLGLPPAVQEHLRKGTLTAGHARALLTHSDPVAAAAVVIARGLNVRQTEALAERALQGGMPSRRPESEPAPDADVAAVEADLAERLGLRVVLRTRGPRGSLTLHYETLDQLDHILARLGR